MSVLLVLVGAALITLAHAQCGVPRSNLTFPSPTQSGQVVGAIPRTCGIAARIQMEDIAPSPTPLVSQYGVTYVPQQDGYAVYAISGTQVFLLHGGGGQAAAGCDAINDYGCYYFDFFDVTLTGYGWVLGYAQQLVEIYLPSELNHCGSLYYCSFGGFGRYVIASGNGFVAVYDGLSGAQLSNFTPPGGSAFPGVFTASATEVDVFFIQTGSVFAYHVNGTLLWEAQVGAYTSSPVIATETYIFVYLGGYFAPTTDVVVLSPTNGSTLWTSKSNDCLLAAVTENCTMLCTNASNPSSPSAFTLTMSQENTFFPQFSVPGVSYAWQFVDSNNTAVITATGKNYSTVAAVDLNTRATLWNVTLTNATQPAFASFDGHSVVACSGSVNAYGNVYTLAPGTMACPSSGVPA